MVFLVLIGLLGFAGSIKLGTQAGKKERGGLLLTLGVICSLAPTYLMVEACTYEPFVRYFPRFSILFAILAVAASATPWMAQSDARQKIQDEKDEAERKREEALRYIRLGIRY
ncbi:MAG TPA: hypothetical protein VFZ48_04720 [Candidatus Saccharimonadales bacterium]